MNPEYEKRLAKAKRILADKAAAKNGSQFQYTNSVGTLIDPPNWLKPKQESKIFNINKKVKK